MRTRSRVDTVERASRVGDHRGQLSSMPLWHVALSVGDIRETHHWYQETLGLMFARATSALSGPLFSWILGIRGAASTCWWLNDRQDLFQLELFEFRRPLARAPVPDGRPCHVGYTGLTFHVEDLDGALERAERCGSGPLTPPLGQPGTRRVCVRDPDGVLVELMEEDPRDRVKRARPRPHVPAVARCVTLSVADLEGSRRVFRDGLGLREATEIELHRPEHEALWGLAGAVRDSALFWADDFLIEIVSYRQPLPVPREQGYRISDRGVFHICLGSLGRSEFRSVLEQCRAVGCRGNSPAISFGASAGVYVVDGQGFTIELLRRHPWLRQSTDETSRTPPQQTSKRTRTLPAVRKRRRFDGAIVIGADTTVGGELCRLLAEDETTLWLLDRGELSEALAGWSSTSGPKLLLALPQSCAPPARSSLPSSLELMSSLLPLVRGCAPHVTAIADHDSRDELHELRDQLAASSLAHTLATLTSSESAGLGKTAHGLTISLTMREAAEAIYLATLQRRRTVWPRPNLWPPRRGASENRTADGVLILPAPVTAREWRRVVHLNRGGPQRCS
jgi:catechol 2,3-dioxygenase-like lactoylglutathione lyase family enzyme